MGLLLSTGLSAGSFLATQAACCFTSAACRCIGSVNCESSTATRAGYSSIFFVHAMASWLLLSDFAGKKLAEWTHGYLKLNCTDCYGVLAVQRMGFALAVFHLVMAGLTLGIQNSKHRRAGLQNGYWGVKIILWLGLIVSAFFIPNEFFIAYSKYIALPGSAIFIILQLMLLVDFAHSFSERLILDYEDTGNRTSFYLLVGGTVTLLLAAVVLTILMYVFFAAPACRLNQFFISFNWIVGLVVCVLSIAPSVRESNSKSGLSQSSMVAIYATYLIVSALVNEPMEDNPTECNPAAAARSTQRVTTIVGTVFTFIAIVYSTGSTALQGLKLMGQEDAEAREPLLAPSSSEGVQSDHLTRIEAAVESGALPASVLTSATSNAVVASNAMHAGPSDLYPTEDEAEHVVYNYSFFHVIFLLASMYAAMLLTNWNTIQLVSTPGKDDLLVTIGKSWAAVWVKVVSSWLVLGLYAWTLLAPIFFPDREWS